MEEEQMTPLDFIASLDGEAKAAAMTVHNLMTPVWIEITDDPATLPEMDRIVIIRDEAGFENFGCRAAPWRAGRDWRWYYATKATWSSHDQSICGEYLKECEFIPPTHWRPIG
jgi:hypothetical protein